MAVGASVPKAAVVGVLVALDAIGRLDARSILEQDPWGSIQGMAGGTIRLLMFALQGEVGAVVIEADPAAKFVEALFGMTFTAVVEEVVLVGIVMTGTAFGERDIRVLPEGLAVPGHFLVATGTVDLAVFADEGKGRLVVVELHSWGEGIGGMAGGTVRSQGALVRILMTGGTILGKP